MSIEGLCEQFPSRQNIVNDIPIDIGESKVTTTIAVSQTRVVDSQKMQNCGVQIVDVNLILYDRHAEFVVSAIVETSAHSAAGEPHSECAMVVIAGESQ